MSYSGFIKLLNDSGKLVRDVKGGDVALRKSDALQAIDLSEDTDIVILGGEVYELMDDGYWKTLHENWSVDESEMTSSELPMRSQRRAYEYIQKFPEGEKKNIWYTLVMDRDSIPRQSIYQSILYY